MLYIAHPCIPLNTSFSLSPLPILFTFLPPHRSLTLQQGFSSSEAIASHALPLFIILSKSAEIEDLRGVGLHLTKLILTTEKHGNKKTNRSDGNDGSEKKGGGGRGRGGIMDFISTVAPTAAPAVTAPMVTTTAATALATAATPTTPTTPTVAQPIHLFATHKIPAPAPRNITHQANLFLPNTSSGFTPPGDTCAVRPSRFTNTNNNINNINKMNNAAPVMSSISTAEAERLNRRNRRILATRKSLLSKKRGDMGGNQDNGNSDDGSDNNSDGDNESKNESKNGCKNRDRNENAENNENNNCYNGNNGNNEENEESIYYPRASQIDPDVLMGLPEAVRDELLSNISNRNYGNNNNRNIDSKMEKKRKNIFIDDDDDEDNSRISPHNRVKYIDMTDCSQSSEVYGDENRGENSVFSLTQATRGLTAEKKKRFQDDFLKNIPETMRDEVLAEMMREEERDDRDRERDGGEGGNNGGV